MISNPVVRRTIAQEYNGPRNIENIYKSGCSNDQHPLCALKQDVIVRVCIWP